MILVKVIDIVKSIQIDADITSRVLRFGILLHRSTTGTETGFGFEHNFIKRIGMQLEHKTNEGMSIPKYTLRPTTRRHFSKLTPANVPLLIGSIPSTTQTISEISCRKCSLSSSMSVVGVNRPLLVGSVYSDLAMDKWVPDTG